MDERMRSYVRYGANSGGIGELVVGEASFGSRGRGAKVGYTTRASAFGTILMAATGGGVCWLGIHQSASFLEAELRGDLPNANIGRDDAAVEEHARRVLSYVAGETRELYLPLDIRGTAFQIAVWRELCTIARGETRSYGEIARRLGRPSASRAVGHANGANPVAIVIPCHRAIGANGALTGYRWGLEYKRRLLEHEGASAPQNLMFADQVLASRPA